MKTNWKKHSINIVLLMLPFVVLYVLTDLFFEDIYLLEYMKHNHYCYLYLFVLLDYFLFKNNRLVYFLSYGNVIAIILGQVIGDILQSINMAKITDGMSEEEVYRLSTHHGAFIWLIVMLLIIYMSYLLRKKERSKQVEKTI